MKPDHYIPVKNDAGDVVGEVVDLQYVAEGAQMRAVLDAEAGADGALKRLSRLVGGVPPKKPKRHKATKKDKRQRVSASRRANR